VTERITPVPTPAPVAELVDAWNERSADRLAAAFAPGARVSIPPLHLEFDGPQDVWNAATALFAAFGALRYTLRHRYLSPEGVTDEALLEGMQTLDFLGAPPPGRAGAVAARLMMTHDGRQITGLTLWPDVAALRDLSDGVARRIDLRNAGPAAPVVAALRATIPSPGGKFSVGQGRQLTAFDEVSTLLPGGPGAVEAGGLAADGAGEAGDEAKGRGKKDGPKAPATRRERRVRAALAGAVMLVLAGLLVTYVVRGLQTTKETTTTAPPTKPVAAATRAAPSPTPTPRPSPSAPAPAQEPVFDPTTNTFTVNNTLLFELNSATLRPEARATLAKIVRRIRTEQRLGTVTVTGYTDDTGTPAFNLLLSRRRARVVAEYLRRELGADNVVAFEGRGASNFAKPNTSDENRAQNRRVEVMVPPATANPSATPSASPSVSPAGVPSPSAT
jgi:outer membrane protein OmpA-like peptidoglycan-associated protein